MSSSAAEEQPSARHHMHGLTAPVIVLCRCTVASPVRPPAYLLMLSTMCCHFCPNSSATGAASAGLNPGTSRPSGTPAAAASPRRTNDTCAAAA